MSEFHPLRQLLLARIRIFLREPETIFWVYVFPLLLMAGLGLAFAEQGQSKTWVLIAADSPSGLALLRKALGGRSDIVLEEVDPDAAEQAAVESQRPDLTVIHREGRLVYLYDANRRQSRLAHLKVDALVQETAGRRDALESRATYLEQPGSRYIDWLIPGLLGLNIMGGGLWGVGFNAVDMRIRKLLKRFRATPMRRSHFLLSLMGGRMLFLVPEMTVILVAGWLAFGLEIRGSLITLLAVALVGAASFAGIGLLLACRAQKIETISGILNAAMLPMWMLSGVFFPSEQFPAFLQPVIQSLPLTQLIHALRSVILHGAPLLDQWIPLLVLALWGGLAFPVALRWFRWQ